MDKRRVISSGLFGGSKSSFVSSIIPTVGGNVIINGDFSAWTGGNPDGFTVTQTPPNREITQVSPSNSHGGGGTGAINIYSNQSGVLSAVPTSAPLTAGNFYRYSVDLTKLTAGVVLAGEENEPFRTIWGAEGTKAQTIFQVGTGSKNIRIIPYSTNTDITIDNLSMSPLSNVYAGKITGGADFVITSNITLQTGESIGFVVNADSYPSPSNCVMVLIRSTENYNAATYSYYISILKRVAGVWSLVTESSGLTYSTNAQLKIVKSGTGYSICYNNIYSSASNKSATISDAGIINNTTHFQISTHSSNLFSSPIFSNGVGKYKIFGVGDSKTVGTGGTDPTAAYFKYFTNKIEFPIRNAIGGNTVTAIRNQIDAALATRGTPTPDAVLINLGANDAATPTAQATFEASYLYILDAIHTKWPSAQCYLMKIWLRGLETNCNTLDGYIDNIVASRSSFAHVGADERIFLKGNDDGYTYTTDGVHPNDAGYALTAQEWSSVLGY